MTSNKYGLEGLHQTGKKVNSKSLNVLGTKSYVCRSYLGKAGREGLLGAPNPE